MDGTSRHPEVVETPSSPSLTFPDKGRVVSPRGKSIDEESLLDEKTEVIFRGPDDCVEMLRSLLS